jgi:hypothetical protein
MESENRERLSPVVGVRRQCMRRCLYKPWLAPREPLALAYQSKVALMQSIKEYIFFCFLWFHLLSILFSVKPGSGEAGKDLTTVSNKAIGVGILCQAAQKGLIVSTARYSATSGALGILVPLMWAWLGADLALQSLGTDYGRIVPVICQLAQIRLLRTNGFSTPC